MVTFPNERLYVMKSSNSRGEQAISENTKFLTVPVGDEESAGSIVDSITQVHYPLSWKQGALSVGDGVTQKSRHVEIAIRTPSSALQRTLE